MGKQIDIEYLIYEKMCSCCPNAKQCHENCESCEEYDKAVENYEISNDNKR